MSKVRLLEPHLIGNDMKDAGEIVDISDKGKVDFLVNMGKATADLSDNPVVPVVNVGNLGPGPNPRYNTPDEGNKPTHPISPKEDDKKDDKKDDKSIFGKSKS